MYLGNCGLQKPWLDKCLKSAVSEDPSKSNMVNRPKHCSHLIGRPFGIFIEAGEDNLIGKSLS